MTENNMPNGNNSSDEMQQVVREDVPAVDNEKDTAGSEEPAVVLAMPDSPKKRGVSVFAVKQIFECLQGIRSGYKRRRFQSVAYDKDLRYRQRNARRVFVRY